MKKTTWPIALLALLAGIGIAPSAVRAQAETAAQTVVTGSLTAGVQAVGETGRSSKFTEYRDIPRGTFLQALDLDLKAGRFYASVAAKDLRQDDQRLELRLGSQGTFRLDLGYAQIPHRFSFHGATPYVENVAGVFTLNDVIRSAAEALVPTGTSTNIAAARALVSSFLTSAGPIDLGLRRKTATLDLALTPSVPVRFDAAVSHENRGGNRPYGASLGFSNAIELPEPIRYDTTNLATSLEFHKGWGTLRAGMAASFFDNGVQTLVWDNPYRITDSTYPNAYSAGNGTALGRLALPPSNDAVRFYVSGSVKPLARTRLSAAASYGIFSQDAPLLPFTINTAIPGSDPNAVNALSPPRETAQAKADVTTLDLTVSSRPLKAVTLTAGFRYYDFANKIAELDIPTGYARLDQVWENVPVAVEPFSFARTRLFGDVALAVAKTTSVKIGYSFYGVRRHEGAHELEKNKTEEGTFKASLDSRPADWLSVRVSYLSANRDWSLDDTFVAYVPGFNFKRFFEAGRDRRALNASVGLSPFDRLDIQMTYAFGRDDYPASGYGLTRDDFDMYGLDLSYAFSAGHSLYAFYSHELYATDQAARQSGAAFSTNPLDDWTANLKDSVHTIGAGHAVGALAGKLGFDVSAAYSKVSGSSLLDSPAGGAPDLAVNYDLPLDATAWWTVQASLKWRLTKSLSAVLGYWYERYDLDDIVRNDVAVDYATAGAVFLGALEPGYKYHVGSLKLVYGW